MAHFAQLNEINTVLEVIVVDNEILKDSSGIEREELGIAFLISWCGGYPYWKQTSYNGNFRKNYAGIGYTYDSQRDAFIPPKPYGSWLLNEETCQWEAPVPHPTDGNMYVWDEPTLSWVLVPQTSA
jgi:hypothetical protein